MPAEIEQQVGALIAILETVRHLDSLHLSFDSYSRPFWPLPWKAEAGLLLANSLGNLRTLSIKMQT